MLKVTDIYVKTKKDSGLVTGVPRDYPAIEGKERRFNRTVTIKIAHLIRRAKQ
jgi:hypothetical protein